MKIKDKLFNWIAHTERIKEILAPEFSQASGASIDSDDWKYRRVSQTKRDLEPMQFERALNISLWLYERDPFAKRIIDIPIQAMASAGITFESTDKKLNELWIEFWEKPITGFRKEFFDLFRDIKLMGEGEWPVAVNSINGDLELGYIDPVNVKSVKMLPGNVKQPDKIILKDKPSDPKAKLKFDVIRMVGGQLRGDILHFAINKPINSSRGRPHLIALIDWIDLYDQSLFNEVERWAMLKNFLWHATIEGGTENDCENFHKKHFPGGQPPKPGTVLVTNEKVTLEEKTPDLKAADASEMAKMIRNYIVGGAGYPDFFFGWGGDTNVATAREMTKPTIWMIENDQRIIENMLTFVFTFYAQNATTQGKQLSSGRLSTQMSEFTITANNIFPRDLVQLSNVLVDITNSVVTAKSQKLIDEVNARKIFAFALNELGYEITAQEIEEELEKAEKEDDLEEPGNGKYFDEPEVIGNAEKQASFSELTKM